MPEQSLAKTATGSPEGLPLRQCVVTSSYLNFNIYVDFSTFLELPHVTPTTHSLTRSISTLRELW
jgi:hypothetical protein